MPSASTASLRVQLDALYRRESRRVFASLVRLLNDFELADDALHEAFAAAILAWEGTGIPDRPVEWLISTGRFKAIEQLRRQGRLRERAAVLADRGDRLASENALKQGRDIEDDRLRLIFTCCHPLLESPLQAALTLREVCGLTTEEIANAFLTTKATMAQRIVRAKARLRDAGIPFEVPEVDQLPARLDSVLATIYLVFNEGYVASTGESLVRPDLSAEAIRLGRLLLELLPDPEVKGLVALMLLHESRREARVASDGAMILLDDQDRQLWDRTLIAEGIQLVEEALRSRRFGAYTIQAAIGAIHAEAPAADATDWNQIVVLYSLLQRVDPSPVIALNRAVAVAMRDGPDAGLELIDGILLRGELVNYGLAHSARGELLKRAGRRNEAVSAFGRALELARLEPERRFLERQLALLTGEAATE